MNPEQTCRMLHKVMQTDSRYTPSESPSTFLVAEVVRQDSADALQLTILIIDPSMPDNGDAVAYLELDPAQRLTLELSEVLSTTAPGISAVVRHAPMDESLWKACRNNKNKLVKATRAMATKAAVVCLEGNIPAALLTKEPKAKHEVLQ